MGKPRKKPRTNRYNVIHTLTGHTPIPDKLGGSTGVVAEKLAVRPDYQNGPCITARREEVIIYNTVLADNGKEAADQWLGRIWQSI
jgi:hypothetical protein